MKIENLKELEKLIQLCKRKGVQTIEVDGIKLNLHQDALDKPKSTEVPTDKIETPDALTDEQLLFWSSGGGQ